MILPQPPPLPAHQINAQDESHLKVISICHYAMAGFYLLGIGFVILHFLIMATVLRMVEGGTIKTTPTPEPIIVENAVSPAPEKVPEMIEIPPPTTASPVVTTSATFPKEMIPFLTALYVIIGVVLVTLCVCNALSGHYIKKRKNRIFSFIIAGLNCLQFPLGTALGVFTFIVLTRDSVRISYGVNAQI